MRKSLALIGLAVTVVGCERPVTVEADGLSLLSTVHLVTSLGPDDNERLRGMLGTLIITATAEHPPILLIVSESVSPAFNFHVESNCATATNYVQDLLTRAATAENLPLGHPDIACVEVGRRL